MMRSKLFVPGSRPEFFEKAMRSAADALTFDLEDAVAPAQKPAARRAIGDFLASLNRGGDKVMIVRSNGVDHPQFAEDVDAVMCTSLDYISLPKLESADEVRRAVQAIAAAETRKGIDRRVGILATVESPKGLRLAYDITSADPRVAALQVGLADLFAPLRIERHAAALGPVRFAIKMAAAEAGVPAYDTVWTDVADRAGYERDARDALRWASSARAAYTRHRSTSPTASLRRPRRRSPGRRRCWPPARCRRMSARALSRSTATWSMSHSSARRAPRWSWPGGCD